MKGEVILNYLKKWYSEPSFACTTFLFRLGIGFVYATIFISLLFQVSHLIGGRGLLPIQEFVTVNNLSYFQFPTLHLFFNSDFSLYFLLIMGIVFSASLILGYFPRSSLIGCFIIFLSYVTSGRDFFHFQWDNLLLEASFLALFLPLQGKLMNPKKLGEPSKLVVFLFWWLSFRLYFESGIAKWLYGKQDYLVQNGMTFYYETAPLPSFGGWFTQQLIPDSLHYFSTILTYFFQLGFVFLLFSPRQLRIPLFYFILLFNIIVGGTSNYGFFNVLAILIAFFLLDDEHILKLKKVKNYFGNTKTRKTTKGVMIISFFLILFVVPFSIYEYIPFMKRDYQVPSLVQGVQNYYHPFRIVDRYHLFPGLVNERIVIEIMGSINGQEWEHFKLKHTPQGEKQMPPFFLFHQARFPFQYSFVSLGRMDTQYFQTLLARICENPQDIKQLLEEIPHEDPTYIRLDFYNYTFSQPSELLKEGKWWRKQYKGSSQPGACP